MSLLLLASLILLFVSYRTSKKLIYTLAIEKECMDATINTVDLQNRIRTYQLKRISIDHPYTELFFEQTEEVNEISNELYDLIEDIKSKIVLDKDEINAKFRLNKDLSNKKTASRILLTKGYADTIEVNIIKARESFITLIEETGTINTENFAKNNMPLKIDKPQDSKTSWAEYTFNRLPNMAVLAILTKLQMDIRNTQSNIIEAMLSSISIDAPVFDELRPVVNVPSGKSSVLLGEKYEAEIFLAIFDSKSQPKITLNGQALEVKHGRAQYSVITTKPGINDLEGEIIVKNKSTGEVKVYPYKLGYYVYEKLNH